MGGYALAERRCVCHAGTFVTSKLITLLPKFRAISAALDPGRTEGFYTRRSPRSQWEALTQDVLEDVGGGVRIQPESDRISGRHRVQYVAQCVACAARTLVVWRSITNLPLLEAIRPTVLQYRVLTPRNST